MPGDNSVQHPDLIHTINFTEHDHLYIDNHNKKYMSVTTLISHAFPKFEIEKIAEHCSKKRGINKQDLINEWKQKGQEAARLGTRLHENMEHYILNEFDKMHEPENMIEKIKFNGAIKILEGIKSKFKPERFESEKLIFSPSFEIAGSIDLLIKINDDNYIIVDYKSLNKDIEKESYMGKTGCVLPTINILDSNYWHYALQLQIYENILKSENYVNQNSSFKRLLIIWNGTKFKVEKLPYIQEAWQLMLWKRKFDQIDNK